MVPFYDDALLDLRFSLFLFVLLLSSGCHNNAHLRTQKPLQSNEKVVSLSAVLPTGGGHEINEYESMYYRGGATRRRGTFRGVDVGVIGPRVVICSLTGKTQSETGFYGGFGLIEEDSRYKGRSPLGLLLGTQRKKYLNLFGASPQKVGAVFELNILSEGGPTIQLFPSITTTTNKNRTFYFGAHGILVSGINKLGLADYEVYDFSDDGTWEWMNEIEEKFKYNSNSLGLGLTVGAEPVFNKKSSFQLQIDLSIVKNNFSTSFQPKEQWNSLKYPLVYENGTWKLDQKEEVSFLSKKGNDPHFIISGSIWYNFFKPSGLNNKPLSPLPPLQPWFDPETGEQLNQGSIKFDPETGETIKTLDEYAYIEEGRLTKKQIIDKARKNARRKHIGALWNVFGLTGLPSGMFGSIIGLFTLGEVSDGVLALPGFIVGGMLGLTAPSIIAKSSSRITKVNYPTEIINKEEKETYKTNYRSEVGVLRQKSTSIGTLGSVIAFAGFIFLLVIAG